MPGHHRVVVAVILGRLGMATLGMRRNRPVQMLFMRHVLLIGLLRLLRMRNRLLRPTPSPCLLETAVHCHG